MKRLILFTLLLLPCFGYAETPGMAGFLSLKRCVMQNDPQYCRSVLTPNSYSLFDRFLSYKLMPCLPTDFTYESESAEEIGIVVKATMPAGGGKHYVIRLVYAATPDGPKLDIPASLKRGLGDKWENQIELAEQLYLMMRQNMGDKLNCDMLNDLIKPH